MACWCINPTPEWIDLPGKNDAREAPGPADAYRLLYEDAQRSIASQEQKVDELRSRAGILLSAAAVVSAFLGAGPLTTDRAHPATVLGVLAFAGVVATTLAILVPWPFIKWEWRFGTKKILGD